MEMKIEKMLTSVTDFIKNEARTETVIGKPFMLGEFNCIPVIRVGMGIGTGAGESDATKSGHGEGGGLGAGMGIEPIGFMVSRDKEISFISTKSHSALATAFEKVPELIEKYLEQKNTSKEAVMA